ncbi:ATP-binding protein [Spirochaeta isovalerica]|uniref:histidine kinase n=1 Tax=Spirochaeta isovalerica TaxID=150 RepID=A0A841R7R2_9SPIO|nr:ATP-binding protein [Spirochaeta isovalerica]MBB6479895.1 PAS domain S-box-containing protein [Spirochaeta isovalerica]
MSSHGISDKSEIRHKAEKIAQKAKKESVKKIECMGKDEISDLIHNLNVHKIELELQNEDLIAAQESIEALQNRYYDLYDLAPVGYLTLSREGLILETNLTAAQLLGLSKRELANSHLQKYVLKDDVDQLYLLLKEIFATKSGQSCEIRMNRNGKTAFWVSLDGVIVPNRECDMRCRIIISDISLRKKREEEKERITEKLSQMQKLDSIGILAGGIAHDFNNLLNGFFLNIEMVQMNNKDEKLNQYLENTINCIDRARSLTQQLLTFSKGGSPVKREHKLLPLIEEIVNFAISGTSVVVQYNIDENLWSCNCDKNQISQVIDNLIINALQSMNKKGLIVVDAENTQIGEGGHETLSAGEYVKISIKDHGSGIDKKDSPYIFDPFFTTKDTGTGLGLSTCYSIIKRHGGYIDFESTREEGSVFYIFLPACRQSRPLNLTTTTFEDLQGSGTIIVLDDEMILCQAIKDSLESFGYRVEIKNTGEDLISFLENGDCSSMNLAGMILDLTIPGGLGGKDIIGSVRKICPQTTIIVSSGYSDDPVMAYPEKYGFNDSIQKPYKVFELLKLLNSHIE